MLEVVKGLLDDVLARLHGFAVIEKAILYVGLSGNLYSFSISYDGLVLCHGRCQIRDFIKFTLLKLKESHVFVILFL